MKNIFFITASALLTVVVYSCKTADKAQNYAKFNYEDLYKVWVVDTIILLGTVAVSTPNIEMDKNEYQFTKESSNLDQGTRTAITSGASFDVSYTIKDGIINFNPAATFPITKFDENGNLVSSNFYATLPPYTIVALSPNNLTLKNNDILVKLKAKKH